MTPDSATDESPNHALQRTGSAVTASAANHRRLSARRQVPRPLRLSLSLGSFGDSHTLSIKLSALVAAVSTILIATSLSAEPLPPVTEIDSLGYTNRSLMQTTACIITAVHAFDDVLNVEFTGRWVPLGNFKWADTDKNGLSITRDKSISKAAWADFVQRFQNVRGKPITLLISGGYAIRGGTPSLDFPQNVFQLIQPGQTFDIPIGYQF